MKMSGLSSTILMLNSESSPMSSNTTDPNLDFEKNDTFYDLNFEHIASKELTLSGKTFENCTFQHCDFSNAHFIACKFVDCIFRTCNLTSLSIKNSSFNDVTFENSKIIGINWTTAKWPYIRLCSPIRFYKSNVSHSSFFGLELKELVLEECKCHNVDFRDADISNGIFTETDFESSVFIHTNMYSADFTDATNYNINPSANNIKKAKFSFPEVLALLNNLEIEILGI